MAVARINARDGRFPASIEILGAVRDGIRLGVKVHTSDMTSNGKIVTVGIKEVAELRDALNVVLRDAGQ